jgi:hypothetical protein
MYNSLFWKDTLERVFFTALQTLLAILTVDGGLNLVNFDWQAGLATVGVASLGALVKALAAKGVGGTVSPASLASDDRGV